MALADKVSEELEVSEVGVVVLVRPLNSLPEEVEEATVQVADLLK